MSANQYTQHREKHYAIQVFVNGQWLFTDLKDDQTPREYFSREQAGRRLDILRLNQPAARYRVVWRASYGHAWNPIGRLI